MLICVTVYCAATALCVVVQNPWQLIVARCAAHFGAQGMAVVAIVVLTEFVPATARGRLQTYKVAVGSLGIPIAAWAGYFLVPQWTWGWRLVFGLGLFGVVFAWLIRRWVPESPRWLASRGEFARAEEVVRSIERQCGIAPSAEPVVGSAPLTPTPRPPAPAPDRPRPTELLARPQRRRFLVVADHVGGRTAGLLRLQHLDAHPPFGDRPRTGRHPAAVRRPGHRRTPGRARRRAAHRPVGPSPHPARPRNADRRRAAALRARPGACRRPRTGLCGQRAVPDGRALPPGVLGGGLPPLASARWVPALPTPCRGSSTSLPRCS